MYHRPLSILRVKVLRYIRSVGRRDRIVIVVLIVVVAGGAVWGYFRIGDEPDEALISNNVGLMRNEAQRLIHLDVPGATKSRIASSPDECGYSGSLVVTIPAVEIEWDVAPLKLSTAMDAIVSDLVSRGFVRKNDSLPFPVNGDRDRMTEGRHLQKALDSGVMFVNLFGALPGAEASLPSGSPQLGWVKDNRLYLSIRVEPSGC